MWIIYDALEIVYYYCYYYIVEASRGLLMKSKPMAIGYGSGQSVDKLSNVSKVNNVTCLKWDSWYLLRIVSDD